jgi:hypothetical protein
MKYKVEWIVSGELVIEAATKEQAEQLVEQLLVGTLTDADRWPAELGAQGIQGAATLLDGELVS